MEAVAISLMVALSGAAVVLWVRAARERWLLRRLLGPEAGAREGVERRAAVTAAPATSRFFGVTLRQAGVGLSAGDLALLCAVAGLAGGWACYEVAGSVAWACLAGMFAAYVPYAVLSVVARRRVRKLEAQLADAIDMLVGALESGVSVRHSMELVRSEMRPPIAREFNHLLSLVEFGASAPDAFRTWSKGLGSKIVDSFAIAMAAKWDVGGSYGDMLTKLARRIRESIRLRRHVESLTAHARLTAAAALMIPYALAAFVIVRNPAHLDLLMSHPAGSKMFQFAVLMQLAAIVWIRRMLRVEG
jgi:tight adherence protein B